MCNSYHDIIGNRSTLEHLISWLRSADIKEQKEDRKKKKERKETKERKKAVYLWGPPGIGKTAAAHLVAKECGYDVCEIINLDVDNFESFARDVRIACQIRLKKKQILLLDEIDLLCHEDRCFGNKITNLLATVIPKSANPIILTGNLDKGHPDIRTFTEYCLPLEFKPIPKLQLGLFLKQYCDKNGFSYSQDDLASLADMCSGDVRLSLNQLHFEQLHCRQPVGESIMSRGVCDKLSKSIFAYGQEVFDRRTRIDRLFLLGFHSELLPLLVYENIPKTAQFFTDPLERMVDALDAVGTADIAFQHNYTLHDPTVSLFHSVCSLAIPQQRVGTLGFHEMLDFPKAALHLPGTLRNRKCTLTTALSFLQPTCGPPDLLYARQILLDCTRKGTPRDIASKILEFCPDLPRPVWLNLIKIPWILPYTKGPKSQQVPDETLVWSAIDIQRRTPLTKRKFTIIDTTEKQEQQVVQKIPRTSAAVTPPVLTPAPAVSAAPIISAPVQQRSRLWMDPVKSIFDRPLPPSASRR